MENKFFIAVKGLVIYENKLLLIKRSKQARGEYSIWEGPGGRLEFGETPLDTLKREIREETCLRVHCIELLSAWNFFKDENTEIIGLTYLCRAKNDQVILSKEHDQYAWVSPEELEQYHIVDGLMAQIRKLKWKDNILSNDHIEEVR